jgi:hypothetical protein
MQSRQVSPTSLAVLENAVHFAALCTMTDGESIDVLPSDRGELLLHYCSATERGLAENGLLHRPDIMLLQAFVIYLVSNSSYPPRVRSVVFRFII